MINEAEKRMRALIHTISLLLVMAVAGCGGSNSTSITTAPPIAFLSAIGAGPNAINGFGQQSDGEIASLALASFPTSPIPVAMTLHPSKNFLYVANATSNAVSGFTLDHTTGDLAPVGTAVPPTPVGTNPVSLGVNSSGQFLFVLNQGS